MLRAAGDMQPSMRGRSQLPSMIAYLPVSNSLQVLVRKLLTSTLIVNEMGSVYFLVPVAATFQPV